MNYKYKTNVVPKLIIKSDSGDLATDLLGMKTTSRHILTDIIFKGHHLFRHNINE